jgi:DNA-binding transcriptional MerR regulator
MNYTISQIAEIFHLEPHTLRYYEKEGILSPNKSEKGIRIYSDSDIEQLEMVCCLKNTGMPIKDIRKYFELCAQGDQTVAQRLEIFTEQRQHILDEMEDLKKHLAKIECKIKCYKEKHGVKEIA